jgi:4-hydroxythreonine-4-phosphate dehydrogenase
MGDPTGIGPEVIIGAIASGIPLQSCVPIAIGNSAILKRASDLLGVDIFVHAFRTIAEAKQHHRLTRPFKGSTLYCLETGDPTVEQVVGPKFVPTIDYRAGQAAYDYVVKGVELCLKGELDGLVTAPLHKVALSGAGHQWPGHTELLADLCGTDASAMMLYLPPGKPNHGGPAGLGVVHVTLHCALREVFEQLSVDSIFEKIRLAREFFSTLRSSMGLPTEPKIAVAALNPHAGESGRFGDEESSIIRPAVEKATQLGWNVSGPLPVDTLMPIAVRGDFDVVVAMYHDQGHIALKLLDMFEAVNITLGLPIIRTSVAHGTAHDIAWKGIADCGGMVQAILVAARLASSKQ